MKIISDIIRLQSDEIVNVYTHMENKCIEKDGKLAIFFSREIIFSYEKFKIIKLYSAILRENKDMDKLKLLGKKILKNIIYFLLRFYLMILYCKFLSLLIYNYLLL